MNRLWIILILFMPPAACSQDEDGLFSPNEFSIGPGGTFPAEKDPLNIVGEAKILPSFGLSLGYRRFLKEHFSLGVRGYGHLSKLQDYSVVFPNAANPVATDFDLSTFNITFEAMMLFGRRPVQLYGFLLVGYATGALQNDQAGTLHFHGVTGGGGLGLRFAVTNTVGVTLEALASFGAASWSQRPFTNSTSDRFNPSLIMALASVLIWWG